MKDKIKEKKYNIWFFHHYATPPTLTGLRRPYDFSKQLLKMGHKATVFASSYLHYSNEQLINNGDLFIKDNSSGVPFIYVRTHSAIGNGLNRVINMFDFAKNLYRVAKKEAKLNGKPDVIIASSPHPLTMIVGNYLGRKLNVPCICEVRDLWPESLVEFGYLKKESLFGKLLYSGEKWIYKKADSLIFTMKGGINYIKDMGWEDVVNPNKIYHINNGVDLRAFEENIEKYKVNDDIFLDKKYKNIIYSGSIRKVNNLDFILDVAKILKNKDTNYRFLIYGNGNEVEKIKNRINEENINNVKYMGILDKQYVPSLLTKSYINLMHCKESPLHRYGISANKLFEYLASGRCIVQTLFSNYNLLEEYNCGLSVDKQSPENVATILLKLNENPGLVDELSRNTEKAAKEFDFKVLTDKLIEIIETTSDSYYLKNK
ncbi:MAG: glycosyltransferase family 4 protein [Peptoniphilus harei]|uniref:glycosyltransferase family 4 protein n=1 Tax=Peptoniphilus harei TaxID=54005 RepID=UPI0028FF0495|nr:glycosyltransferase family 4 protein [Peptoniphilus harei]MDU3086945.1 glycosyltransferase family 4 protein [Peptoniphilus harei]